ncbi:RTC4-like domain-containing protein [Diaporthe sp. PMI_573]|nr:RTC4-like domain-containing protein [Diaporthaceae sp. PMI_573]
MPPIQLSRNIRPLLKFVRGKPRDLGVKPMEEPEDVTAPPIDSDENETDEPDFGDPHYDSTDDEPTRGDIGRSDFKSLSTSQKPGSVTARGGTTLSIQDNDSPQRRSARSGKKRAIEIAQDPDADDSSVSSSKKRAKATESMHSRLFGSHIGDGFLVDGKIQPAKAGYGKKAARAARPITTSRDPTPHRKFERVKSMSESVSPQQTRNIKILSPGSEASSPFKKPRAQKVSRVSKKEGSSSLSDVDSDDVLSDPPRPNNGRVHVQKLKQNQKQKKGEETKRRTKKAGQSKPQELSADEAISQRPAFKMPEGYNDFASAVDLAGIDMPLYQDTTTDKKSNLGPDQAPCPMCDEPVDKQWLDEYSKGQRMSIARQAKFCHQHKKRTARELWKTKGYPSVDWEHLETRIGAHQPYLESLINGATSHFGERLREKIRTGRNRTLFTMDEYPVPGYYGLRGMSAMTESIVDAFSSLLRERAPRDRLISARGHTGYVQSVLVPELGVRLIKEDMGIEDDAEARAVMRESRAVGVILNDERADPRVASQAQAQVGSNGGSHGDEAEASGIDHNESGTDGGSDGDDKVDLRIQQVDDSDSDASSLSSLGGHGPKASGKGRLADGDSEPGKLASLGKVEEPIALGRDVVDDSDSDLSSLVSLDKL